MPRRPRFYVNAYHVQLAYGGPEEGGWWYDTGTFLHGLPAKHLRECETIRLKLLARFWHLDDGPKSNVNSQGEIHIYIDRERGKDFPQERPYYS